MSDDDDDVAITAGMEAPVSIEDHRSGARPDDGDEERTGDEPSGQTYTRGREISNKTRELFASAAKSIKQQMEEDGDGEFGQYDEGATRPDKTPGPAPSGAEAVAHTPATPTQAAVAAVPDLPAVPSLSPEVQRKIADLDARMSEVDAREAKVAELERASDMSRVRSSYLDTGARAISDMVRSWMGKDVGDDDFRAEIADLITDLSGSVLGVEIPSEIKTKIEAKRALRSVKAYKESLTESEAAKAKREQVESEKANRGRAISALDKEISDTAKAHAKQFPYLASEDNPGEIIMEVCEAQLKRDGTVLQWTEAAKLANEFLRKQASAYFDKRKHLLTAAPAQAGSQAPGTKERPQSDPQGHRRSPSLTNAQASEASRPSTETPHAADGGKWSREAHRANTKRKYRAAFTAPEE